MADPKEKGADAAGEPRPYDGAEAHRALLDAVHGRGAFSESASASKPEVYQYLMARERRVLDTVDRVVNDARRVEEKHTSLLEMPLQEVIMRAMSALKGLFQELLAARSLAEAKEAFAHGERRVFLGVCLVLLGFCLAFIQASS